MKNKISAFHLVLLTMGSVIGCGWLFSPYYGYQTAGIGVILSWLISAGITIIIGYSFAIVCVKLPAVGGVARFTSFTHERNLSYTFLFLGWLGYVVYAPLEAQSMVQYLGFWINPLVVNQGNTVVLSKIGVALALALIIGITWFNTLIITRVAKANTAITLWKILIPLAVALIIIICFGSYSNVIRPSNFTNFSMENVFLAITSSGIAFAFSGFQNGLIVANNSIDQKRSLQYSLYIPILLGVTIYLLLSIAFLAVDISKSPIAHNVAPLLGLVSIVGLNYLFIILFVDAVISPMGATNVFIAVTSRILYSLGLEFAAKSILTKENSNNAPVYCLWINAAIGAVFLLPLPTWQQLVTFLSSVVIFAYLPGPMSLMSLTKHKLLNNQYLVKNLGYLALAYISFSLCGLLIYWSGLDNLLYLVIVLLVVAIIFRVYINRSNAYGKSNCGDLVLVCYVAIMCGISYLRSINYLGFPIDNVLVIILSIVVSRILNVYSLTREDIVKNIDTIKASL